MKGNHGAQVGIVADNETRRTKNERHIAHDFCGGVFNSHNDFIVCGFSLRKALDFGLTEKHLICLRYFADKSGGERFFEIDFRKCIADLHPIVKKHDTLTRYITKLHKVKVLKREQNQHGKYGTKTWIRFDENYKSLLHENNALLDLSFNRCDTESCGLRICTETSGITAAAKQQVASGNKSVCRENATEPKR